MSNLFDLTGKKAIVTGTSGQLGPIWCRTLRDAGAEVWEYDYPEYDVRDKQQLAQVAKMFIPDIVLNSAAIDNPPGSGASFFGKFNEIVEVNLSGAVNVCEAFIPGMVENGGGVIVNIGSIMGSRGAVKRNYSGDFEKPVGYSCSKAALVQLSRSITTQYGDKNIRSVTIGFGPVDTPKLDAEFLARFLRDVPLGRPVSKQSLQTALLFACCCPEISGQLVLVDGGFCA